MVTAVAWETKVLHTLMGVGGGGGQAPRTFAVKVWTDFPEWARQGGSSLWCLGKRRVSQKVMYPESHDRAKSNQHVRKPVARIGWLIPGKEHFFFFPTHPCSATGSLRIPRPTLRTSLRPKVGVFVFLEKETGTSSRWTSTFHLKYQRSWEQRSQIFNLERPRSWGGGRGGGDWEIRGLGTLN